MMPASIPAHPQTFAGLGPLDWALVLVLAFSALTAFMRGLIRSVVSLAGVVLGIVLAAWYAPALGLWLVRWIHGILLAETVAFVSILAATYLLANLLGRVLRSASQAVGLGIFDRLGGAAFGVARAVVVLAAVLIPLQPFLPLVPFTGNSVLLPYLRSAAVGVSFVVPQDFGNRLAAEVRHMSPSAAADPVGMPRRTGRIGTESTNEGDAP
jgi:membrane protein required for colicin V production